MKQATISLYTITELKEVNKKAYERILEREREQLIDINFDLFSYDIKYYLRDEYGLEDCTAEYSLSSCQGDGLRFDCPDMLASSYIRNKVNENLTPYEKGRLTRLVNEGIRIYAEKSNYRRYSYAAENDIQCNDNNEWIENKILPLVASEYMTICAELEKIGYSNYDVSDDDCIESLLDNEICFTAAGVIVEADAA